MPGQDPPGPLAGGDEGFGGARGNGDNEPPCFCRYKPWQGRAGQAECQPTGRRIKRSAGDRACRAKLYWPPPARRLQHEREPQRRLRRLPVPFQWAFKCQPERSTPPRGLEPGAGQAARAPGLARAAGDEDTQTCQRSAPYYHVQILLHANRTDRLTAYRSLAAHVTHYHINLPLWLRAPAIRVRRPGGIRCGREFLAASPGAWSPQGVWRPAKLRTPAWCRARRRRHRHFAGLRPSILAGADCDAR